MDELYQSARLGPQPLLGSAWYVETKSRPSFRPRRIAGPPGGESAPSADRRVPSTRARASTGKTPVVLARHHRSRAPGKEGTAERSDARGGDAPGKTGRRKQVRRKMRIDVQILSRQESTAGKASPCVHGGDPVREA
ncbi:MAG: hypothetical protein AMXMBFR56_76470 [Polyangiaceae bacterium]